MVFGNSLRAKKSDWTAIVCKILTDQHCATRHSAQRSPFQGCLKVRFPTLMLLPGCGWAEIQNGIQQKESDQAHNAWATNEYFKCKESPSRQILIWWRLSEKNCTLLRMCRLQCVCVSVYMYGCFLLGYTAPSVLGKRSSQVSSWMQTNAWSMMLALTT